ncbi:MAG: hypothetical protein IKA81_02445 [Alistipes sp.]|nr:hypothetical protein [Alistipes sp.]
MINRLIGIIFTILCLAAIAYAIIERDSYSSMIFDGDIATTEVSVENESEPIMEVADSVAADALILPDTLTIE